MAHVVFLHTAAVDLTAGKPVLVGVPASATLSAAAAVIPASPEAAVVVWRDTASPLEPAANTIVGLLSSLDVVVFVASHAGGAAAAMRMPAGDVVAPEAALVREVDPDTRLIDTLELMKQGVRRVLVRKNITEGCTINKKPCAPCYKTTLKITGTPQAVVARAMSQPSSSALGCDTFCCLTREDILRFLIGCLGALAPIPLTSVLSLGAVSCNYSHIESSSPAIASVWKISSDPGAVAVVETSRDGSQVILGDISAYKLWKCDCVAAADAMAKLSALNFATGLYENGAARAAATGVGVGVGARSEISEIVEAAPSPRSMRFSSRSIGFFGSYASHIMANHRKSALLTCKSTSSLAAVMAQMLSHRATHVWVTKGGDSEDAVLVGVVGYTDIFNAVTRSVAPTV